MYKILFVFTWWAEWSQEWQNRLIYDLALLNYEHVYNITYNLYIGYKNSVTEDAI